MINYSFRGVVQIIYRQVEELKVSAPQRNFYIGKNI